MAKKCTKCLKTLPEAHFHWSVKVKNLRETMCKPCRKEHTRRRKVAPPPSALWAVNLARLEALAPHVKGLQPDEVLHADFQVHGAICPVREGLRFYVVEGAGGAEPWAGFRWSDGGKPYEVQRSLALTPLETLAGLLASYQVEVLAPACQDCGVGTEPGPGSARCPQCWADRSGPGEVEEAQEPSRPPLEVTILEQSCQVKAVEPVATERPLPGEDIEAFLARYQARQVTAEAGGGPAGQEEAESAPEVGQEPGTGLAGGTSGQASDP